MRAHTNTHIIYNTAGERERWSIEKWEKREKDGKDKETVRDVRRKGKEEGK